MKFARSIIAFIALTSSLAGAHQIEHEISKVEDNSESRDLKSFRPFPGDHSHGGGGYYSKGSKGGSEYYSEGGYYGDHTLRYCKPCHCLQGRARQLFSNSSLLYIRTNLRRFYGSLCRCVFGCLRGREKLQHRH